MKAKAANAYQNNQIQTGVNSSGPGELIILVYDRIFDHLKLGKMAIEQGEHGMESFTKAHDLIQQGLLACLDFKAGGEIAQSLAAVYEWSLREIISGRTTKSPEKIQNVINVLTPLYDGWLQLAPKEYISHLSADMSANGSELVRGRAVNY